MSFEFGFHYFWEDHNHDTQEVPVIANTDRWAFNIARPYIVEIQMEFPGSRYFIMKIRSQAPYTLNYYQHTRHAKLPIIIRKCIEMYIKAANACAERFLWLALLQLLDCEINSICVSVIGRWKIALRVKYAGTRARWGIYFYTRCSGADFISEWKGQSEQISGELFSTLTVFIARIERCEFFSLE